MPTITKPQVIYEPFCGLGTPGTDYVIPVQTSIDPDIMTQDVGIPVSMQTPLSSGGIPVDRPQTNGYMYLYSSILAWIQEGGTFTFEPTVSTYYTGYPAGTVLWAASVNNFVVSLVNNNTNNFVTTPSFIDGVHWQTITALTYPDITDVAGLVSIIGANGLVVNHNAAINGTLNVVGLTTIGGNLGVTGTLVTGGIATFLDDGLSAIVQVDRSTTARPGGVFNITSEASVPGVIPGETILAVIELSGITGSPALGASYSNLATRWQGLNCMPGDTDPVAQPQALAILGDVAVTQNFTVSDSAGNTWDLLCTTTGKFPSLTAIQINGFCNSYTYPIGSSVRTINLATVLIAAYAAAFTPKAATSITQSTQYGTVLSALEIIVGGTVLNISAAGIGATQTSEVQFYLTYK